jgi:hypothetical protein
MQGAVAGRTVPTAQRPLPYKAWRRSPGPGMIRLVLPPARLIPLSSSKERDRPICRRCQPTKPAARRAQGALPSHPSGHPFAPRAEGKPAPGLPGDFRQFLPGGQVVFLLAEACPPLLQWALVQMPGAEEGVHHALTGLPQHGSPMLGSLFVATQQASGRADPHPFCQRRRAAQGGVEVGASPRRGGARGGGHDAATPRTATTRALALPIRDTTQVFPS